MPQQNLIVSSNAFFLVFTLCLFYNIWHCWLTRSPESHGLVSMTISDPPFLYLAIILILPMILFWLPLSQKVVLLRVFVLRSVSLFFLTSLVPWVTDSTPKAFNKMYKLVTLFKSCISYYARIIPWKNSPKEFQSFVFNSSLFPHLSNNIISINFSHASWKLLIIQDSPLFILLSSCL